VIEMKTMHVSLLLDETGSMQSCLDATISGYNEYINILSNDKKNRFLFTLTKFDSAHITTVHNSVPIKDVPPLNRDTYIPGQMTPLYDAIAYGIKALGRKRNVLFVILTDGMENASREYTHRDVFRLIEKKKQAGWSFVYLGANQDAFAVGGGLGIPKGNTARYSTRKTAETFEAISRGTMAHASRLEESSADFFSAEDLSKLDDDED
jgi:hypothetical protein